MQYYSYVVYSPEAGQFYYGYSEDTEKALELHNSNQIEMTRGKGPWVLMFSESFDNKARALRQSRFYRTIKGQRFLKKILNF
jgi:putative endonuclease